MVKALKKATTYRLCVVRRPVRRNFRSLQFELRFQPMSRIVKRPASEAATAALSARSRPHAPLPGFVPPQLSRPVEKPPSGPQWVHEIKLDGFRMAARVDNGRVQLLTRTGLDWTGKYPSAIAALANVKAKTAYIDGELCGLSSRSPTKAAWRSRLSAV